jgi:branched-chain amino acid transport system substrate-binding protein
MKQNKQFLISLLFLALAEIALPSLAIVDSHATKTEVKIGVIAPLTGGLANRGDDIAKLIQLVEPYFNASSNKYRYKFILDDGMCGAGNAATTIAKKFIEVDKVKFLITGCSGETLQVGPIAQREGILTIAVMSTHQDVKKLGDYIFRTFVDIERGVEKFASYMSKKSNGKIALLTEENAFTFGIKELLVKYLGDKIIYSDDYPAGTSDFRTLLAKIKAKNPNGIYFNALSEITLANLVNQARDLGLKQNFYSYNMPEARSFRDATKKNAEGMEFIGSPEVESTFDDFQNILTEFNKLHPEGPSYEFLLRTFFDAAKSIVDAVEAVGPEASLAKDFLKTYRVNGALGVIEYDENGDIKNVNYFLSRISNGKVEAVGDLMKLNIPLAK